MPNWKKLIVSGSDASLNSLNVTTNVTAQSFTGSFSGSFTAPGATTQVVYNNGGVLAANSGFVYSGSYVGIGTTTPSLKFNVEDTGATYVAQFKGSNSTYIVSGDTSLPGESGFNARNSVGQLFLGMGPNAEAYFSGTSGATALGLYLGGTNALYVNSSRNVGIGTTSPGAKLQISGGTLDGSALTELGISSGLTTGRLGTFDASSLASISTRGDASSVELAAGSSATYYTGISATANNATLFTGTLRFFTSGSEKVRIDASGNVGIGTTSPGAARLNVVSSNNSNNPIIEAYALNLSQGMGLAYSGLQAIGSNADVDIVITPKGTGKSYFSTGNVGIGTSSPSQKLEVNGQAQIGNDSVTSAGLFIARKNTNQAKSHYFLSAQESPTYQWIEGGYFTSELAGVSVANNSGKPYYESYSPAGQYKSFGFINQQTSGSSFTSTAATASMVLYQGGDIALAPTQGNVGIGTSSPGAKLQVVGGEIRVDAGQAITLDVANNMYLVGASNQLRLYNGGNPVVNITTGGNVGIGTTDPTSQMSGTFGIGIYNALYPAVGFKNSTTAWLWYGQDSTFRMWNATFGDILTANTSGNIGIGTNSPSQKLSVVGAVSASTYYGDGSNLTGIGSGSVAAAGSDGQLQYNNSGLFGGASRLYYNDSTNRVGIGTSSPGYDLDVSGSVRVQDKLRVGPINTGNGVIHQSSDATINASSSTIVWSVPGSSGAVAFIEYYIINTVTSTSQRGGNIVVTWNSAGTPQITHTETTTPDIGTTALVTFTTAITLGGDPQLVATNTSINPFYIVLNYRYF